MADAENHHFGFFAVPIIVAAFTSYFVVDQKELSAVLRFGRFNRIAKPGLNLKLPFGLEKNYNVPAQIEHPAAGGEWGCPVKKVIAGITLFSIVTILFVTSGPLYIYLYDKAGK